MGQPNDLLREARERKPSASVPTRPMSRQELADAVNAHVFESTGKVVCLDDNYLGKLERGVHRWPGANYRAAFRAVLGADCDADLGFYRRRERPVVWLRPGSAPDSIGVDVTQSTADSGTTLRVVVVPGAVVTVALGPVRLHIEAAGGAEPVEGAGARVYKLGQRTG